MDMIMQNSLAPEKVEREAEEEEKMRGWGRIVLARKSIFVIFFYSKLYHFEYEVNNFLMRGLCLHLLSISPISSSLNPTFEVNRLWLTITY